MDESFLYSPFHQMHCYFPPLPPSTWKQWPRGKKKKKNVMWEKLKFLIYRTRWVFSPYFTKLWVQWIFWYNTSDPLAQLVHYIEGLPYRKRDVLGSCCFVSKMLVIQFDFQFLNCFCTCSLLIRSIPCCCTSFMETYISWRLSYRRSSSVNYYSLLSHFTTLSSLSNFSNPSCILYNVVRSHIFLLSCVISSNFSIISS